PTLPSWRDTCVNALPQAALQYSQGREEAVPDRLGFLIDMDGVIYRGKQLIPGADRLIQRLLAEEIPFAFLTNNSQRTRRDVATRLARMGIPVDERHIFTCA